MARHVFKGSGEPYLSGDLDRILLLELVAHDVQCFSIVRFQATPVGLQIWAAAENPAS